MLLLSKEDIKSVITMKDMIEADKQAFKMVVDGTVDTPLRTVINGKYDGGRHQIRVDMLNKMC